MLKKAATVQFEALPRNLYGSATEHHEEPQSQWLVGALTKVHTKHKPPLFHEQVLYMSACANYFGIFLLEKLLTIHQQTTIFHHTLNHSQRLRVASGVTAQGPALERAPCFRPKVVLMSLSSYILR
jgi:hypothetical protein